MAEENTLDLQREIEIPGTKKKIKLWLVLGGGILVIVALWLISKRAGGGTGELPNDNSANGKAPDPAPSGGMDGSGTTLPGVPNTGNGDAGGYEPSPFPSTDPGQFQPVFDNGGYGGLSNFNPESFTPPAGYDYSGSDSFSPMTSFQQQPQSYGNIGQDTSPQVPSVMAPDAPHTALGRSVLNTSHEAAPQRAPAPSRIGSVQPDAGVTPQSILNNLRAQETQPTNGPKGRPATRVIPTPTAPTARPATRSLSSVKPTANAAKPTARAVSGGSTNNRR